MACEDLSGVVAGSVLGTLALSAALAAAIVFILVKRRLLIIRRGNREYLSHLHKQRRCEI